MVKAKAKSKTKNKKTLRSEYEAVVNSQNITLNECKILCFKFDNIETAYKFHIELLIQEHQNKYYLFDAGTETVKIVIKKNDTEAEDCISRIAEEFGGKAANLDID